jgi:hypothetical protein
MDIYAKRRDETCVDYDNCKAVNCLCGVVACVTDQQFVRYMKLKGHHVIWVDDLDAAWEKTNGGSDERRS